MLVEETDQYELYTKTGAANLHRSELIWIARLLHKHPRFQLKLKKAKLISGVRVGEVKASHFVTALIRERHLHRLNTRLSGLQKSFSVAANIPRKHQRVMDHIRHLSSAEV